MKLEKQHVHPKSEINMTQGQKGQAASARKNGRTERQEQREVWWQTLVILVLWEAEAEGS